MRKWLPLLAVSLGTFMLLLDVTIVNVALPSMATGLHASFTDLQWVVDIYALALAALLLGVGSLADLFGRRRLYVGGLVLFAVASAVCGAAPDATTLIVARAVQGIGAAAMFATTIALIAQTYRGKDAGIAFGVWGAVSGAAAALGPITGGLLTEAISWRWVFFVNLPISIAAVVLTLRAFEQARPRSRPKIDVPGIAVFTAAASMITYALIRANDAGWTSAETLGLIGAGAVALALFAVIESLTTQPMLDLRLLKRGSFTGVVVGAAFLSASAFASLAYTSIWLQSVIDLSPIETGLVMLPLSASAFAVSAGIGRFLHDSNPRWIISGGVLLIGIGSLLQANLDASSSWGALTIGLLFVGVGVGLASPTLVSTGMGAVPRENGGMASGAVNTGRQLGFALGIAVLGGVFQSSIQHHLADGGTRGADALGKAVSGGGAQGVLAQVPAAQHAALDHAIRSAVAGGLQTTYLVAGGVGIVGAAIVALLVRRPSPAPWEAKEQAEAEVSSAAGDALTLETA
ncbi:MAG: MFS transporter [Solirubrobacteraceae bacterium]